MVIVGAVGDMVLIVGAHATGVGLGVGSLFTKGLGPKISDGSMPSGPERWSICWACGREIGAVAVAGDAAIVEETSC